MIGLGWLIFDRCQKSDGQADGPQWLNWTVRFLTGFKNQMVPNGGNPYHDTKHLSL
jgi:hypothetical protein